MAVGAAAGPAAGIARVLADLAMSMLHMSVAVQHSHRRAAAIADMMPLEVRKVLATHTGVMLVLADIRVKTVSQVA
jgi:hypothetical protein